MAPSTGESLLTLLPSLSSSPSTASRAALTSVCSTACLPALAVAAAPVLCRPMTTHLPARSARRASLVISGTLKESTSCW